jgi:hypothetical protein
MSEIKHKLILKAIRHYKYSEIIDNIKANEEFYNGYSYSYNNYKKNKYDFNFFISNLTGIRTNESHHIAAKNLLFQGNSDCWKYFERTALFWTMAHINSPFIDDIKYEFEYALYIGQNDLLNVLIEKSIKYLDQDEYKTNKEYIKQKVFPSTQLVHFLVEKWLGHNPLKEKILKFGNGYGIYQRIIDDWDKNFVEIEDEYWNSLCEYHLKGISITGTKREDEEFIGCGLIPMELINIFQVRKKLGLDIPTIKHELFQTPMAVFPTIPTGYNQELDVKFQLVYRTVQNKQKYTYEEIETILKKQWGQDIELFY